MRISDWFTNDSLLTALGAIVGFLWAAFKSSEWCERRRTQRFAEALQALEAGVEQTYRTYVRKIKEGKKDGRLSEEEIRNARILARQTAIDFGRTRGVDVLRAIGEDYVDLWIAKLVTRLKGN